MLQMATKIQQQEKTRQILLMGMCIFCVGMAAFLGGKAVGWWGASTTFDYTDGTGTKVDEVSTSSQDPTTGTYEPVQLPLPTYTPPSEIPPVIYIPVGPNDPAIDDPEVPDAPEETGEPIAIVYIPPSSEEPSEPEPIPYIYNPPTTGDTPPSSPTSDRSWGWIKIIIGALAVLVIMMGFTFTRQYMRGMR